MKTLQVSSLKNIMGLGIVGKTKSKLGNGAASAKNKGMCFVTIIA